MKIYIDHFWLKKNESKIHQSDFKVNKNKTEKNSDDPQLWRNLLAYWILGLCTEFGYVVIICAAHDILHRFESPDTRKSDKATETSSVSFDSSNFQTICDTSSTGVLLVADILPSVLMNILLPWCPLFKNFRMALVTALNVVSLLLIANSEEKYLAIVGVVCTSLALGIGEVTLLSYSAQFNKKVITAWSSGTGAAGIIGSITYASMTGFGISSRDTMRVLLIIPILEALTFWMLLRLPKSKTETPNTRDIEVATIEVNCEPNECALPKIEIKLSGVQAKLQCLPSLVTFICPLVLVFIFEYICVSGLFEMIYIRNTWLDHQSQYRWFQVVYQVGVFVSRTTGTFLRPRQTWWAPIFQFLNACFFMYESVNSQNPSILIILMLVFWVGVVGGLCYVHSFQRLIKELPASQHKFSLGMLTIAESFGIAIGGFSAIPIHNILCRQYIGAQ